MEKIYNEKEVEEVVVKEVKEVKEKKKADPEEFKLQELVPEPLEKNKDSLTNSSPLATEKKTSETLSPALKTGSEKQESFGSAEMGEKRSEDEVLKEGKSHEESKQLITVESIVEVEEKLIPDVLESNIDGKSTEQLSKAGVVKSIDVIDCNKSSGTKNKSSGTKNKSSRTKNKSSGTKNRLEPTESSSNQFDSTASKFGPIRIREDLLLKKPLNIKIKTEEHNTAALQQGKQPPNNATTKKQQRKARRRLRLLTMSTSQNRQMNAVNLPENPDTLGSHGKRVEREPFINQENRSWYPQLSPQNPENFVALPSTSREIVVESADLWSRDWLTYMVPRLNPLNGTFLKVVGLESLDKFYRATMWIPGMIENPESILQRLERQNSTLKTEVWRIYSVSEEFTPNGYYLILGIPHSSVQALQEVDFKPYLGLSRVTICVNGWT